ncbi:MULTISPECIES: putative toxin-antitoxin system toxin component, PIN family [Rhizobium/Agrobacterium group]|uniref:Toxin-antitoxin system toxin component, PIN family n=1 Tax=Neorhizobium petrolearium TaxID=515361 RepID=A0ABY8M1I9_9HYPH|nr:MULTISPECIES: putative toxin-antitoxin system toxin component, PIN family [Rhizobium/Agrobacterium group]KGD86569.1 toxin-antitoxin system toxin component, PIN family protein [Rhizobium sp. YS-1r]MCC2613347.1 putative toxin-antitoxin system toxin component, PIN family [Neorhizobium petrolearium]WGI68430.1 putative toxin-antitoxin system toxin component, PIN family [Neorhizobium petrolearium]
MKVVVDTNIFISAIMNAEGTPRQVIRLCLQEEITPLMANALFSEYEDVCSRDDLFVRSPLSVEERAELLQAFFSCCQWVSIYFLWRPNLRDEADNHILELAISGGADVIITANKRDFAQSELAFPKLKIFTAGEFLAWRTAK